MNNQHTSLLAAVFGITAIITSSALAKDEIVSFEQCPAPVQAIIRHYSTQGTLEEIGYDEKKKAGGPAIYEVKFSLADGRRIEVHITADGKVQGFEEKKRKN